MSISNNTKFVTCFEQTLSNYIRYVDPSLTMIPFVKNLHVHTICVFHNVMTSHAFIKYFQL